MTSLVLRDEGRGIRPALSSERGPSLLPFGSTFGGLTVAPLSWKSTERPVLWTLGLRRGTERVAMARTPENPDRNFSVNGDPEETEKIKTADKRQDVPTYEDSALYRSGALISSAVLNAKKRRRSR